MSSSVLLRMWQRYQWCLTNRPYVTNATTGCIIGMFGDCMAQTVFKDLSGQPRATVPRDTQGNVLTSSHAQSIVTSPLVMVRPTDDSYIDLRRSMIFASFTIFFGTPFWLVVYKWIDKVVPKVTPVTAIKKGMISWTLANTTTPLFIAYLTTLDRWVVKKQWPNSDGSSSGEDVDGVRSVLNKIRRDVPVMMSYSIMFWSIQWIPMFYLLPPHFRLVYASMLQIVWSGVTSYLLHRSDPEEQLGGGNSL